jgi:hypothetical protein
MKTDEKYHSKGNTMKKIVALLAGTVMLMLLITGITYSYAGRADTSVPGKTSIVLTPGEQVILGIGMLGLAIYGKRRLNRES